MRRHGLILMVALVAASTEAHPLPGVDPFKPGSNAGSAVHFQINVLTVHRAPEGLLPETLTFKVPASGSLKSIKDTSGRFAVQLNFSWLNPRAVLSKTFTCQLQSTDVARGHVYRCGFSEGL